MQRLQRHQCDPVLNQADMGKRFKVLFAETGNERLEIRYWRQRWRFLDNELTLVRHRQTTAAVFTDGSHAGSLKLFEYRLDPEINIREFLWEMDAHSDETAELAYIISKYWSDPCTLSVLGPILEYRSAWMHPAHAAGERFAAASSAVLRELFRRRSILLLKAFPLEYRGRVSDEVRPSFKRRQKALVRLYRRTLGVTSLPGEAGEEGWMYAVPPRLSAFIPSP